VSGDDVLLEVRGLRAGYGAGEVLHGVDLSLDEGGCVAVLGPNGAGKSTLLQVLAGHVRLRGGSVTLAGAEVGACSPEVLARCGLYLLPEGKAVFPTLTVVAEVFAAVARFSATGTAVVLVEQYVHRALAVADAAVVLAGGRVVWSGPSAELDEADLAARYLGGTPVG